MTFALLLDFLLFCCWFFGMMACTFLVMWVILVACDWVEDKIWAWWNKHPKSRLPFGW